MWLQRIGGFTSIPALIRELGEDSDDVLACVGLSADDFADPENRVPFVKVASLLHDAAVRTRTPHFGLLAGRAWHLTDLGIVGTLLRHSRTVREALGTLVAHQYVNSQGGLAFLWTSAAVADFGYAVYRGGTVGIDQICDAALALGANIMRELCGAAWQPSEVLLPHAMPRDVRHYRNHFRVTPRFNCEYCALRFPESQLDTEVIGADRELRQAAAERIAAAPSLGLLQGVLRTLRIQLLAGECSGDSVAQALGVHRRTLNRRLREKGTTFQRCLDLVRFEVACQILATSRVPLDDIAAALGYASVSPFMRTFRRWSGTTPAQWRRASDANGARAAQAIDADNGLGGQDEASV